MPETIFDPRTDEGNPAIASGEPHAKFAPAVSDAHPTDLEQLRKQLLRMIIHSEAQRRQTEPVRFIDQLVRMARAFEKRKVALAPERYVGRHRKCF